MNKSSHFIFESKCVQIAYETRTAGKTSWKNRICMHVVLFLDLLALQECRLAVAACYFLVMQRGRSYIGFLLCNIIGLVTSRGF